MILEAVPNASEGRDGAVVDMMARALGSGGAALWDVHADPDHNRSVFTLAGSGPALRSGLVAGAARAVELIDMRHHDGAHPCVGALDVAPVVYLDERGRESACETAIEAARAIGSEVGIPVFLYGELASDDSRRQRAQLRRGGMTRLARRLATGDLRPDFGPPSIHPTAGAALVAARPPLVAFNVELATDDLAVARRVAERVREGGGGLPGVRAIAVLLATPRRAQVSMNIERPAEVPLAEVVAAVGHEAGRAGTSIGSAEIVGLVPEGALAGFPSDVELVGFDPARHVIERRLVEVGRSEPGA